MELAETSELQRDRHADEGPSTEPSVTSSLEHLVAGSQGMITKRIDLALLEAQELVSRSVERAALVGAAMVLAAMAWFATAGACVLLVAAEARPVGQLAAFGLLNGVVAAGLVAIARSHRRLPARPHPNVNEPTPKEEASAAGRN